jgi:hypothetical protein
LCPSITFRVMTHSRAFPRMGTSYMISSMIFSRIARRPRAPVPLRRQSAPVPAGRSG